MHNIVAKPGILFDQEQDSDIVEIEEDACLFQLFYQKLIEYFGHVVYSLELNETRQQLKNESEHMDDCASNLQANGQANGTGANNQLEIITTIAADDLSSRKNVDFKLDNAKGSFD